MDTKRKKVYGEIGFVAVVFFFTFLWAAVQPFNVSPDEHMRYDIVEYLVEHGRLPHGGDPEIRNEIWGISYAFNPIFSYMISAFFVKVVSLFAEGGMVCLLAARMTNVLFTAGTAWFTLKIGDRLFQKEAKWLFAVLICFLPGFLFVGSYVNNDAMALFSGTLICYVWVRYLDEGWTVKNCIWLGVGLSLCLLSYYNAYGWVLVSFLFFTVTALFCEGKAWNWQFWLKRGLVVAAVAAVLAGWWFLRNALLYDGDLLGMRTSSTYGELYAQEGYKPSQRQTMQVQGYRVWEMLFYQAPGWEHNWLITVLVSFVGTFGYMTVFMPYGLSKVYWGIFVLGAVGILFSLRMFGCKKLYVWKGQIPYHGATLKVRTVANAGEWDKQKLFHTAMLAAAIIPVILLLQYAYASDLQAQGRYLLPMLLPMMYFVTRGYENLVGKMGGRGKQVRRWLYPVLCTVLVGFSLYTFVGVFLPFCRG